MVAPNFIQRSIMAILRCADDH